MDRASGVCICLSHVVEEIKACPVRGSVEYLTIRCAVLRKDLEEVVMNGSQRVRSSFMWPFVVVFLSALEEGFLEVLTLLMDENDILDELQLGTLCPGHTEQEFCVCGEEFSDCQRFISGALRRGGGVSGFVSLSFPFPPAAVIALGRG